MKPKTPSYTLKAKTTDKRKATQRIASAKVRAATQTKLDEILLLLKELLSKCK